MVRQGSCFEIYFVLFDTSSYHVLYLAKKRRGYRILYILLKEKDDSNFGIFFDYLSCRVRRDPVLFLYNLPNERVF